MYKLSYINSDSTWDEALPLGNGFFGAMAYSNGSNLSFIFNHYDVFYSRQAFPEESKKQPAPVDTSRYHLIMERAQYEHEHTDNMNYNFTLYPEFKEYYGWDRNGRNYPVAFALDIRYDDSGIMPDETLSELDMSEGRYLFRAISEGRSVESEAAIARNTAVAAVSLETAGAVKATVKLMMPDSGIKGAVSAFRRVSQDIVCMECAVPLGARHNGRMFRYCVAMRLEGANISLNETSEGEYELSFTSGESKNALILSLATMLENDDPAAEVVRKVSGKGTGSDEVFSSAREYWQGFMRRSSISIPDKMLQKLWNLSLYSLDCSCGTGAILYQNACGLSGLWSIKQPSQWGSLWYWDVNIEQAFWPVYTANRLKTGEAFVNGLLSFADAAREMARTFYGYRGIAGDYPFEFYMSLWPWCAQFFWWHYRYSGDEAFLREKAFPLFQEILYFYEDYIKLDEATGLYYIFPDISPEQGPVTRNSTITLACLKYLLEFSIESSVILGENEAERGRWKEILNRLPDYSMSDKGDFGKALKDSEWADANQYLAHGSPLMPIYPVGHISKRSDESTRQTGLNTVTYAGSRINLCTHTFAWEAAAQARLGYGTDAVRSLYEKGIAYQMRTNGMFAEETERWMQNCVTALAPVYNPPLMEGGSALTAAINEMLLQSFGGIIEVFPAVPDGRIQVNLPEDRRFDSISLKGPGYPDKWEDAAFENLLAEGAFEISAERKAGMTVIVKIRSLAGNTVKMYVPFNGRKSTLSCCGKAVQYTLENGLISFGTVKGQEYILSPEDMATKSAQTESEGNGALVYTAPTRRRVFLGKDSSTDFLRELDNITFDYFQGDIRTSRVAPRRFDFSLSREALPKNYASVLPRQFHACGKMGLDFIRIGTDTDYASENRYGWRKKGSLIYMDHGMPDEFRRDSVGSAEDAVFSVMLARGSYQLYVGTGDSQIETMTDIRVNGESMKINGSLLKAGRYRLVCVPFYHDADGEAEIILSSCEGRRWNVSLMIFNRVL